jgi:dienelactone hydrolase
MPTSDSSTLSASEVTMTVDHGTRLIGDLVLPKEAIGLVVFAHGSGSSRFSSRNRYVAGMLNSRGLGTLLFDLLTPSEEPIDRYSRTLRFDMPMLASRLTGVVDWLSKQSSTHALHLGLFGASTGAAAALMAAARRPWLVRAVVSRGGRPDLAGHALEHVKAPTLLLIGGEDHPVIEWNRDASKVIPATHRIAIVPGATHLFEEPGTLESVASQAGDWFQYYLVTHANH